MNISIMLSFLNNANGVNIKHVDETLKEGYQNESDMEKDLDFIRELNGAYKGTLDIIKSSLEKNKNLFPEIVYNRLLDEISSFGNLSDELLSSYVANDGAKAKEVFDKMVTSQKNLDGYIKENLEEIVTHALDNGQMTLDDIKNQFAQTYMTPEYKSALQNIIDKKEKNMAEQAAIEEEKGEKEAEEVSYADRIDDIKNAYEQSQDKAKLDAATKDLLFEMFSTDSLTPENINLLSTLKNLQAKKEEQPEKNDAPVENEETDFSDVTTEEVKVDPILQMLDELGVSVKTKEAVLSLDKNLPATDYSQMVNDLIYGDKINSLQEQIAAIEKKKDNNNGKLGLIDNIKLSSLYQQKMHLENGLNLSLHQRINLALGSKRDTKINALEKNISEVSKKHQNTKNYFRQFVSCQQAEILAKRINKLSEKNLKFNGQQVKTEIATFNKKTRSLKLKSDFIAFNTTVGTAVKASIKSIPEKLNSLKTQIGDLVSIPVTMSDNVQEVLKKINGEKTR